MQLIKGKVKTIVEEYRDFRLKEDPERGFRFDRECLTREVPRRNYEYCLAHPDEYDDFGWVRHERQSREEDAIKCDCGKLSYLCDSGYYGAYKCPRCGRWYNRFGQELLPPDQWEEDEEYD